MIRQEASQIKTKLLSEITNIGITDRRQKRVVARLMAKKLKDATKDAVYQYVINQINDELSGDY